LKAEKGVCSTPGCEGRPMRGMTLCAHCFVKSVQKEDRCRKKYIDDHASSRNIIQQGDNIRGAPP
jgi:hypothetical protein